MIEIEPLINRIAKNARHFGRWAKRQNTQIYRVYDRDIPEFPIAIDCYGTALVVWEYELKGTESKALDWTTQLEAPLARLFQVSSERIFFKTRRRKAEMKQYEKLDASEIREVVRESGLQFEVNFSDYLDTGIFPDHRMIRQLIMKWAKDTRFLNLFCYTGTASVYAAIGGATQVTSVDLSNTYLAWAKRNFGLNQLDANQHQFVRSDVLRFVEDAGSAGSKWDMIFVDPPSFSNSKAMSGVWDVQRDHVRLLRACMKILEKEGKLLFSNNLRSFCLEKEQLSGYVVEEWTRRTLPPDYRNRKIHRSWLITRPDRDK